MKKFTGLIAATILATGYAPTLADEPVAARNIRAGELLAAADIETPASESGLRQAADFIGKEAARSIYRGQRITEQDLRAPTLVARNAVVTMEFSKGRLSIATEGRALDPGAAGARIRVMNIVSRRVVSAVVVDPNTVRIKQ